MASARVGNDALRSGPIEVSPHGHKFLVRRKGGERWRAIGAKCRTSQERQIPFGGQMILFGGSRSGCQLATDGYDVRSAGGRIRGPAARQAAMALRGRALPGRRSEPGVHSSVRGLPVGSGSRRGRDQCPDPGAARRNPPVPGRNVAEIADCEAATAILEAQDNAAGQAEAWISIGWLRFACLGDVPAGRQALEQASAYADQSGNQFARLFAMCLLLSTLRICPSPSRRHQGAE
jgi:hypothetical protein